MEEAFRTQTNMLCRNATNSGRAQPFEEIFRLHHRRVYSLCLRMIGNSTEAEDLTQDVFVQVFRKLGSFRGESAFTTWLHRLTVNQVLMHFRKNDGRNEQLTEDGEMPVGIMLDRNRFNRSPVLDRLALDEAMCSYHAAIAWSSSSTTLKDWNTVRSRPFWAARSERPSRNYIEPG